MRRAAQVVIGANFGDEGKGLITDYLASQTREALVVRFNGGAQAGHTVVTPAGFRHVFHHFGSGLLANAKTYLSRFFICNPVIFCQEMNELLNCSVRLAVFADPQCLITTQFDRVLNQMLERSRGDARHGSCGVGINETVARSQHPRYAIRLGDLADPDKLMIRLIAIRDEYVPKRLSELGLMADADMAAIRALDALEQFTRCCRIFNGLVEPANDRILRKFETVIFSGAAGLLLDEQHHWFPHVTRSRTGLHHVVQIAQAASINSLDVYYTTRAYATRHGPGPFPTEMPLPYDISDDTNTETTLQGPMRYGLLSLDTLHGVTERDLRVAKGMDVAPYTAVTCLDQVGKQVRYVVDGVTRETGVEAFFAKLGADIGQTRLASSGRTREKVWRP
jgi:adenylosuccinate synthase